MINHVITSLRGPWQVGSGPSCRTWYLVNTKTGKFKRIGPTRLKGINYFDKAVEEAIGLNKSKGLEQLILALS